MAKKEIKDVRDELIDGALKQAWDMGFNYGVAWIIKQLEEGSKKEGGEDVKELLEVLEQSEQFKGISDIYENIK